MTNVGVDQIGAGAPLKCFTVQPRNQHDKISFKV